MLRTLAASLLLLPVAASAAAVDWAAALRKDAQAMHDDIAANHPGTVDPANPGFARVNDTGLALALDRAKRTKDYAGYWYAMRAYSSSFDDGHLNFSIAKGVAEPILPSAWPGFLTAYDMADAQRVVTRADDAPLPLGARLIACDGRPSDRLAAENVGAIMGRWSLRAQRVETGGALFIDHGNPWITRPARCTFEVDGKPRELALTWRPIGQDEIKTRFDATYRRLHDPIGLRTFPDGTAWLSLSDFNGDPDGPAAKALVPLIADLRARRDAIVGSPRIVLDLRGNNGGSSDWSLQIARAIWGDDRVNDNDKSTSTVEWRVSKANIASIREFAEQMRASKDASREMLTWADRIIAGMTQALAAGQSLWKMPPDSAPEVTKHGPVPAPRARIFMVTDSGCGSACLDAADLWLSMGAVHVGEETGADTFYMDIRKDVLPSGIGRLVVPMKVYRGRTRGANVSLVPAHPYKGDLTDTVALERWIAALH